jgi:hypothetical protein
MLQDVRGGPAVVAGDSYLTDSDKSSDCMNVLAAATLIESIYDAYDEDPTNEQATLFVCFVAK